MMDYHIWSSFTVFVLNVYSYRYRLHEHDYLVIVKSGRLVLQARRRTWLIAFNHPLAQCTTLNYFTQLNLKQLTTSLLHNARPTITPPHLLFKKITTSTLLDSIDQNHTAHLFSTPSKLPHQTSELLIHHPRF